MADSALMKIFSGLMQKSKGKPKVTGRPRKTSTIADLAPLPRGVQAKPTSMAKPAPLPMMPRTP